MQLVKPALVAAAIALLAPIAGCIVSPTPVGVVYGSGITTTGTGTGTTTGNSGTPLIQAFSANVTKITKDSKVTFTVVAHSPTNAPLQYNWSATEGTLSTNTGQNVFWSPELNADGSLHAGTAQISVTVTDGANTATGTLNIVANADGTGTVTAASTAPTTAPASTTPSAAATATAAPTASPSVAATTSPAATATATPAATGAAATGTATGTAAATGASQT